MNEMTDRELLELAAKAAGYHIKWCDKWPCGGSYMLKVVPAPVDPILSKEIPWNPLTDDGDALKLATSLYMLVNHGPCQASASTIEGTLRGFQAYECTISQDHGKAVRRAIVRAAAEIGSQMK